MALYTLKDQIKDNDSLTIKEKETVAEELRKASKILQMDTCTQSRN